MLPKAHKQMSRVKNKPLRQLAILTALILLVSGLSACSEKTSAELRLDVTGGVQNLDPQFVRDTLGSTIVANTMEGLLRFDSAGNLQPAGAESYTVSGDGRSYTFTLRRDAFWSNGDPVLAVDYRFAFLRLFDRQVPSPYAEQYLEIEGADGLMAGTGRAELLGVQAVDDYTLTIRIKTASPDFLVKLADTPAVPCQEEFFKQTRARYGLGSSYLMSNGPYYVEEWDNSKRIVLQPNSHYRTPPECPGVYIYTSRIVTADRATEKKKEKSQKELFLEGKTDIYMATAQEMAELQAAGATPMELQNRVWQLTMNTRGDSPLRDRALRRALVMALDAADYPARLSDIYSAAPSLVPPSARLQDYRMPTLLPSDSIQARTSAQMGFAALQSEPGEIQLTLLLPNDAELTTLGSYLQKQWNSLSLYVNMEPVPQQELQKRLESGDFTLALRQVEASGQRPDSVLEEYVSGSLRNYSGWQNSGYDMLLAQAGPATSVDAALRLWEQAEQQLIDEAVAAPMFGQSSYFAFSKGTANIQMIAGRFDFSRAVRTA